MGFDTAIIPLSNTVKIARDLEKYNKKVVYLKIERFPDDELDLRLPMEQLEGVNKAVVIYSGQPNPDMANTEAFHVAWALEDEGFGPETMNLFALYMDYGRHDKKFKDGQPVAGRKLLEDLSRHYGKIHAVDYHSSEPWVEKLGIIRETLVPYIMAAMGKKYHIDQYLVFDKGARDRLEKDCGVTIDGLIKDRLDSWKVKSKVPKDLAKFLKNRNIGIIEDIISTGGTACTGIENLRKARVKKIYVGASHGAFMRGLTRVAEASDDLFLGDTIDRGKYSNVTCLPLILKKY
ncbi:MAG: hypothetical protein JSV92_03860 [archaeon]|nr:MAG: hypothetical protein JSV92_03860 [archaeon]